MFSIRSRILLVEGPSRMGPFGRSRSGACGFGSPSRALGASRTPPFGHYDPEAGSQLDYRSTVSNRRAIAARGVWSVAPRKSPWWSAERRGSRSQRDPDTPRKRVGPSQRLLGSRKPLRLSALRSPRKEGEQREELSQIPGAWRRGNAQLRRLMIDGLQQAQNCFPTIHRMKCLRWTALVFVPRLQYRPRTPALPPIRLNFPQPSASCPRHAGP